MRWFHLLFCADVEDPAVAKDVSPNWKLATKGREHVSPNWKLATKGRARVAELEVGNKRERGVEFYLVEFTDALKKEGDALEKELVKISADLDIAFNHLEGHWVQFQKYAETRKSIVGFGD